MPTSVSFGKWWPLDSICVPTRISAAPLAASSSAASIAPFDWVLSLSIRTTRLAGKRHCKASSSRCVPSPSGPHRFAAFGAGFVQWTDAAAMVTAKLPVAGVYGHSRVATTALRDVTAGRTDERRRESSAVEIHEYLAAFIEGGSRRPQQVAHSGRPQIRETPEVNEPHPWRPAQHRRVAAIPGAGSDRPRSV